MKTLLNSKDKIIDIIFPFISILIAFIVWFILASVVGAEIILPSPLTAIKELFIAFSEKEFYTSLFSTLLRAVVIFILSFVLAFLFATLSYKYKVVKKLLYPIIIVTRVIPTISVILICYLAVTPEISPILITLIVLFPLAYNEILSHFNGLDEGVLEACKVYGVNDKKVLTKYVIPEIVEKSFYSSVSLLGFSVKLTISAEAIIYATSSLGLLMQVAKTSLQTGRLFAYTLVAIILGLILEFIAFIVKKIIDKKRSAV